MEEDAVSSDVSNRTLRDIFCLLQSSIAAFTSESESLAQLSKRKRAFISGRPKLGMVKSQSLPETDHVPINSDSEIGKQSRQQVERQHLDLMRENIQYKETLQNVTRDIDTMHRRLKTSTNIDDEGMQELINTRKLLEPFAVSKTSSDKKLDKICTGIQEIHKTLEKQGHVLYSKGMKSIPMELADICSYIHAKGFSSLELASKLGITAEKSNQIELQYEDEEERLRMILSEWSTECQPKVSTLVKACSELDRSILTVTPLSKQDTTVLERNMAFLIEEMMEVSLLIPYLTADGILSLLSGKYITDKKSRSDRIMALLDILSTNERGLDAFISALQKTDQCHISQRLQDFRQHREDTKLKESDLVDVKTSSENIRENKMNSSSAHSTTVKGIQGTTSEDILRQISLLINRAGIKDKLTEIGDEVV